MKMMKKIILSSTYGMIGYKEKGGFTMSGYDKKGHKLTDEQAQTLEDVKARVLPQPEVKGLDSSTILSSPKEDSTTGDEELNITDDENIAGAGGIGNLEESEKDDLDRALEEPYDYDDLPAEDYMDDDEDEDEDEEDESDTIDEENHEDIESTFYFVVSDLNDMNHLIIFFSGTDYLRAKQLLKSQSPKTIEEAEAALNGGEISFACFKNILASEFKHLL